MAKRKFQRAMAGLPEGVSSGSQLIRDQISKGNDKPSAIVAAIKAETGVNVSPALVNNVKMTMMRKAAKGLRRGPKPRLQSAQAGQQDVANNRSGEGRNLKPSELDVAKFALKMGGVEQAVKALQNLVK
jgi:hypothetical protein